VSCDMRAGIVNLQSVNVAGVSGKRTRGAVRGRQTSACFVYSEHLLGRPRPPSSIESIRRDDIAAAVLRHRRALRAAAWRVIPPRARQLASGCGDGASITHAVAAQSPIIPA